jgi:hypothetical protein
VVAGPGTRRAPRPVNQQPAARSTPLTQGAGCWGPPMDATSSASKPALDMQNQQLSTALPQSLLSTAPVHREKWRTGVGRWRRWGRGTGIGAHWDPPDQGQLPTAARSRGPVRSAQWARSPQGPAVGTGLRARRTAHVAGAAAAAAGPPTRLDDVHPHLPPAQRLAVQLQRRLHALRGLELHVAVAARPPAVVHPPPDVHHLQGRQAGRQARGEGPACTGLWRAGAPGGRGPWGLAWPAAVCAQRAGGGPSRPQLAAPRAAASPPPRTHTHAPCPPLRTAPRCPPRWLQRPRCRRRWSSGRP